MLLCLLKKSIQIIFYEKETKQFHKHAQRIYKKGDLPFSIKARRNISIKKIAKSLSAEYVGTSASLGLCVSLLVCIILTLCRDFRPSFFSYSIHPRGRFLYISRVRNMFLKRPNMLFKPTLHVSALRYLFEHMHTRDL